MTITFWFLITTWLCCNFRAMETKEELLDVLALAHVRELAATGRAREIRESARLSQADLAEQLGTTAASVCRWESGRRIPRQVALAYARLLAELVAGRKEGAAA
jgi:DNA-binding transcriptional regulator YiaG